MTTETAIESAAATAEKVIEDVMKVEPTVASISSMFVPGAAPIVAMVQPWIVLAAPKLEEAMNAIAAGHPGDALGGFAEFIAHLTPGMVNSKSLTDPTPTGQTA